jgi:hypothetical protein
MMGVITGRIEYKLEELTQEERNAR